VRDTRHYALLPGGVVPGMAYRRLTRKQRRALLAAYLLHLFPVLPLAVHECACAAGPDAESQQSESRGGGGSVRSAAGGRNGGGGGSGGAKSGGGGGGGGGSGFRKSGNNNNNNNSNALSAKPSR
jgi:uncharacterized membrane protein